MKISIHCCFHFFLLLLAVVFMASCEKSGKLTIKGISYELVLIPAGEFVMGSKKASAEFENEMPAHEVKVSSFLLGKTEVTQGLWKALMDGNPSYYKKGDEYPVETISWNDVQDFIRKLNAKTGKRYRLPTEAEWEYACRAGTTGDRYGDICDAIAWYDPEPHYGELRIVVGSTKPVGKKLPNTFGLYDMLGNVSEWCQDWYDNLYYSNSPYSNPKGPDSGSSRVIRGGSWSINHKFIHSAVRFKYDPRYQVADCGFRLALDSTEE